MPNILNIQGILNIFISGNTSQVLKDLLNINTIDSRKFGHPKNLGHYNYCAKLLKENLGHP